MLDYHQREQGAMLMNIYIYIYGYIHVYIYIDIFMYIYIFVCIYSYICIYVYVYTHSSLPLPAGDMFQDPQWMPETVDTTEACTVYTGFPYTHMLMIKFSL